MVNQTHPMLYESEGWHWKFCLILQNVFETYSRSTLCMDNFYELMQFKREQPRVIARVSIVGCRRLHRLLSRDIVPCAENSDYWGWQFHISTEGELKFIEPLGIVTIIWRYWDYKIIFQRSKKFHIFRVLSFKVILILNIHKQLLSNRRLR